MGAPVVVGDVAGHLGCPLPTRMESRWPQYRKWARGITDIEDRSERFLQDAFSPAERALLPTRERAYWATAFWCAKEAVGKAKGTGFSGHPKTLEVIEVQDRGIRIEDFWVETFSIDNYMIALTRHDKESP